MMDIPSWWFWLRRPMNTTVGGQ